jgi:pyruvate formate lyase activating enzyme
MFRISLFRRRVPGMTSDLVFNIQRFSIHDGPGIRTTVFLKGCALACFWCHNPEGRHPFRELQYFSDRCISCGECVRVCPSGAHELRSGAHYFVRERCTTHGACVDACCSGALEMNGRIMTSDEVVNEVLQDTPFYLASGGGVTLSGGEPGLQAQFSRDILESCKDAGVHTAIETCGQCSGATLQLLLPVTDLFMMDLKVMTPGKHKAATGSTNERILDNARLLAESEAPLIFRTPVVPTVNDGHDEFRSIVEFIQTLTALRRSRGSTAPIRYELLTFHKLGSDKYRSLDMEYTAAGLEPPTREQMNGLLAIAHQAGIEANIR